MAVKVMITDDHSLIREGFKAAVGTGRRLSGNCRGV